MAALLPALDALTPEAKLPLVDLALPALRRLSPAQYEAFMKAIDAFIRADEQVDLFEYTLTHVLKRHLEPTFRRARPPRVAYYGLSALSRECSMLLSAVAHAGHADDADARRAFDSAAAELSGVELELAPRGATGLAAASQALDKLSLVAPRLKKDLMRSFLASVAHDGQVTVAEGELLRAAADALGLPMPPFLPGQSLEAATSG